MVLQNVQVVSILSRALVIGESSFRLGILLAGPQLSFLYASCYWRAFGNETLWFALLVGSFIFLDVGPFILFLVFPLFWVFWFIGLAYQYNRFIKEYSSLRDFGP